MSDAISTHNASDSGYTVELQWLEHLWDHENMFEIGEIRANEY